MALLSKGPDIVTDGLIFLVDAGNPRSYPGTGTTWYDLSESGYNLSLINAPTYNSIGYFDFNGTSQYAQVSSVSYTPYCIDIWFYNDDNITLAQMEGNYQMLTGLGGYPRGISLGAFFQPATNETITIVSGSGPWGMTYIRDTVSSGLHNLIVNWNGSAYDFWIDGIKKTTYAGTDGHCVLESRDSITVAKETGTSSYEFDGKFYKVLIYNQQLTDAQVLKNYNATKGRYL